MIAKILISPNLKERVEEINKILLLHIGSVTQNHPDLLYFEQSEKLGMEQTKKIIEFFSIKPYSAKGRATVLEDASGMTIEAQNALLKTLEEPPEEAILILGASSDANFLPTILSRCQVVILNSTNHHSGLDPESIKILKQVQNDIEKLLSQDIAERFEYIEKLKDKQKRQEFLQALVYYFRQDLALHPKGANLDFLKELLQAEEWAKANVNLRGILEYLMLKMPK